MKKRVFLLVVAVLIGLGSGSAFCRDSKDDDSTFIKIFTPYHNMKSVNVPSENSLSVTAFKSNESNNFKYELTDDEVELIAKVVYAESKGEPFIGKIAVASVIINRLSHPEFPKTIKDVIYEKNAFSCLDERYMDINPDAESYMAVDEALRGNDPTDDAIFYYNPKSATSTWMKNATKNKPTTIGRHVFFK
ncbi:spore cortex-lytic enzyme precursor [Oxobacter pfennigii]|uniref:Spore cortex-lytic enzyme n=1 Tax=Oxobacter pfennigii TaxID=36849 RepID=A0A0P8YFN3_9CLOT|nr:cell wall hydrolase [Oxobacter pfennigii]KPU45894.1 spore cortex-lytic enzyme precursor [Oxobacter pfennigii]